MTELPVPEDDPRRLAVRSWLKTQASPTARALAEAGYAAPNWPRPWGFGADGLHQLVIEEELARAAVTLPQNPVGVRIVGPAILRAGTEDQQHRFLPPLLAGEEIWCRMYSEPDAGSDLSAVRTRATRQGDRYVINGRKLWAPMADVAAYGAVLVRTDGSPGDAKGLSYLLCPMDTPGLTVQPVRDLSGGWLFNEILFDEVEVPVSNLVGEENLGGDLGFVRMQPPPVTLARGAVFGKGPSARDLLGLAVKRRTSLPRGVLDDVAEAWCESELIRMLTLSLASRSAASQDTLTQELVRKVMAERHIQRLAGLALRVVGPESVVMNSEPATDSISIWRTAFLYSGMATVGAGAIEGHLDQIAFEALGLP